MEINLRAVYLILTLFAIFAVNIWKGPLMIDANCTILCHTYL